MIAVNSRRDHLCDAQRITLRCNGEYRKRVNGTEETHAAAAAAIAHPGFRARRRSFVNAVVFSGRGIAETATIMSGPRGPAAVAGGSIAGESGLGR